MLHLTQSSLVFRRWLRVDTRPLKNAISDLLVEWSLMYTSFLSEFFSKTLGDLHTFITDTRVQLESAIDVHGSNDMMMPAVLLCNRQIRQKRAIVEVTFQPLEVRLSCFMLVRFKTVVYLTRRHSVLACIEQVGRLLVCIKHADEELKTLKINRIYAQHVFRRKRNQAL